MIREFESKQEECLVILMEECGELIQECCKMIRKNNYSSLNFAKEVGDVITMLEIAQDLELVSNKQIKKRSIAKKDKLIKWSNLYNENN